MGAAAFVLVISAANVANLTLMRGVRREHELVVRAALGAGVRPAPAAAAGREPAAGAHGRRRSASLIALGGLELLVSLVARYSPRASEIRLDRAVLGFTLALSVAVALLLSFVGVAARKEGAFGALVSAGASRRQRERCGKQRLQRGLVVAQIAVSVVLLAGAGLLTRTMMQLSAGRHGPPDRGGARPWRCRCSRRPGFRPPRPTPSSATSDMRDEIRALPGVVDGGLGSTCRSTALTVASR